MYILLACIPVFPGSQTGSQAIPAFFAAVNLLYYKEQGGMKCVEGRKHFQGEGVRRENARKRRVFQPAPDVFERGAKSTICRERGMGRFSAVLLWAERSRRPSGYIGCSCMGGAEPRPYGHNSDILVGVGLCPARPKGKPLRLLPAAKSTAPVRGGKQIIGNP